MNIIDGMSYRQWQKRNTDSFGKLSKKQKQVARSKGYFNCGWDKVKQSWELLKNITDIPKLFDIKLSKGDISGAVNQSILEATQAQEIAKQTIKNLDGTRKKINKVARAALNEYQLL